MEIAEMYKMMSNPEVLRQLLTSDDFPAERPLTAEGHRWLRLLLATAAFAETDRIYQAANCRIWTLAAANFEETNRSLRDACVRILLDEAATRVQLSDFWGLLTSAPVKVTPGKGMFLGVHDHYHIYPYEGALVQAMAALDSRDWAEVEAQLDDLTHLGTLKILWLAGHCEDSQMPLSLVKELLWKCYKLSLLPEGMLFTILAACLRPADGAEMGEPEAEAPTS